MFDVFQRVGWLVVFLRASLVLGDFSLMELETQISVLADRANAVVLKGVIKLVFLTLGSTSSCCCWFAPAVD